MAASEAPLPDPAESAGRAVALGNRLLDVEEATLGLRAEIGQLKRALAEAERHAGSSSGGWFEVPRSPFPWPLADSETTSPDTLGLYDQRTDDDVVLEGRRGEAFLTLYRLRDEAADFAGAAQAVDAAEATLRLVPPVAAERPDVSIVIPVYGQLGYTLNCLHSLVGHRSRYSAEIIVVDDCSPDNTASVLPGVSVIRYHRQLVNGGFIQSCNDGAALGRGRFVLLLNNDTRVVDGWLDGLLDSFDALHEAGLVGSKLCYPDGSLQEAGGIIWRDASCWNYGRNDDPNRPQYCHAREVDFVSGCSIALPMELWRQLDGFDPYYKPAYCEDVDLAMRVKVTGRRVWMQPRSRIVHYEGKTSGTDTAIGVKAYQVINMRKLYLRWHESLERHRAYAEAPYFERERGVHRRMLVINATAPTPEQDAGSVQVVLGMRVAIEAGYKVHFAPGDNWLFRPVHTANLQRAGVECAYAPFDVGIRPYLQRYGQFFDVIVVYSMILLEKIIDDLRELAPQATLLFNVVDLHHLRREREALLENNQEGLLEAADLKRRELRLIARSDCTITHSVVEGEILARELPDAPVVVWPMMLDFFGTDVGFAERRDICFLGGYRHPPNIDAIQHFVRDIFPLIRAVDPSIRFLIAGANPSREVFELAGDGVEVLGLVDDLRDLFDRTRVFVCPLRVGAGVKGKVMSALSYGIPIVSTSVGIEGSGVAADTDVLVADDPVSFAQATLKLYTDRQLWERLSKTGMDLIQRKFSTNMGLDCLAEAAYSGHRQRLGLFSSPVIKHPQTGGLTT